MPFPVHDVTTGVRLAVDGVAAASTRDPATHRTKRSSARTSLLTRVTTPLCTLEQRFVDDRLVKACVLFAFVGDNACVHAVRQDILHPVPGDDVVCAGPDALAVQPGCSAGVARAGRSANE